MWVYWLPLLARGKLHVEGLPEGEMYVAAMYWALSTMSTIGYGDIAAAAASARPSDPLGVCLRHTEVARE